MTQAEELLNSLSFDEVMLYTATPETEPHIVIDEDRYITVPRELRRIAVQHDHNIETVTFDCPRYWDGIDMSDMRIYINYIRADNSPGCYEAKNICIDEPNESIMHFDWTITRNVTEYSGNITFLVCIKTTDEEGNEVTHWNSELCADCRVSKGLECSETVLEQYPDIIYQLKEEINESIDVALENLTTTVNTNANAALEALTVKMNNKVDEAIENLTAKVDSKIAEMVAKVDEAINNLNNQTSQSVVYLDLGSADDTSSVMASIDDEDYPVMNASEPTEVRDDTVEITVS